MNALEHVARSDRERDIIHKAVTESETHVICAPKVLLTKHWHT